MLLCVNNNRETLCGIHRAFATLRESHASLFSPTLALAHHLYLPAPASTLLQHHNSRNTHTIPTANFLVIDITSCHTLEMSLRPSISGTQQAAVPPVLSSESHAPAAQTAPTTTSTKKYAVRKMPASNCRDPSIARPTAPSATTASGHDPPPGTYHSTSVQTLPPATGDLFKDIHGRYPTHWEHEHKIGLAARGRYKPGVADPHLPLYGAPIQVTKSGRKATYMDSDFQTADIGARKIALTKAKAKGSMTAKKFGAIVADAGYKLCAESKDERILHSEQHSFEIGIDKDGNVQGEVNLTGRFLPNVYMEASQTTSGSTSQQTQDGIAFQQHAQSCKTTSQVLIPPSNAAPPSPQDHQGPPLQIAAIEPSSREDTLDTTSVDYHDEAYEYDVSCFVIHDPDKAAPLTLPRAPPTAPLAMSKRKRHAEEQKMDQRSDLKRSKLTVPKGSKTVVREQEARFDTPVRKQSLDRPRRLLSPPCSPKHPSTSGRAGLGRSSKINTVTQVARVRTHGEHDKSKEISIFPRERSEDAYISPSTTDEFDKERRDNTATPVQPRQASRKHGVEKSRCPPPSKAKISPPSHKKFVPEEKPLTSGDIHKIAAKVNESTPEGGKRPQPAQHKERRDTERSEEIVTSSQQADPEVGQSKKAVQPKTAVSQTREAQKPQDKTSPLKATTVSKPKNPKTDLDHAREAEVLNRGANNATTNEIGFRQQGTRRPIDQVEPVRQTVDAQTSAAVARAQAKILARHNARPATRSVREDMKPWVPRELRQIAAPPTSGSSRRDDQLDDRRDDGADNFRKRSRH